MNTISARIRFKEVTRLYDTDNQRKLVELRGRAQLVAPGPSSLPALPGVYRSYSHDGGLASVLRTFARSEARNVERACVYVLIGGSQDDVRLAHGLEFDGLGTFRHIDLAAPEAELDTSRAGDDELPVELRVPPKTEMSVAAFLSPYRLPKRIVDALRAPQDELDRRLLANAMARASWLLDPFVTDLKEKGRLQPESESPEAIRRKQRPVDGERVLYLINPLQELLCRMELFQSAVAVAQERQVTLGADEKYRLAKRIEAIVASRSDLHDLVPRLVPYLNRVETPAYDGWADAERAAQDLIRWAGESYRAFFGAWFGGAWTVNQHTFVVDRTVPLPGSPEPRRMLEDVTPKALLEPHNACSGLLYEMQVAFPEAAGEVQQLINQFHEGLSQTQAGKQFCRRQTERCLGELNVTPGVSDGLLGFALTANDALRAPARGLSATFKAWNGIVQNLLPWWYLKKGDLAFATLPEFIQHQTGKDIGELKKNNWREHRRLKQVYGPTHSQTRRTATKFVPSGKTPKDTYKGAQVPGLAKAPIALSKALSAVAGIREFRATGWSDPWLASKAGGDLLSAAESATDLSGWMRQMTNNCRLARPYRWTLATSPPPAYVKLRVLGSLAGLIDTVLSAKALAESRTGGQRWARLANTIGSALGAVGAVLSETGVGVIVALVGMGLQTFGRWHEKYFDPFARFLRACPWGTDPSHTGVSHSERALDDVLFGLDVTASAQPSKESGHFDVLLELCRRSEYAAFGAHVRLEADVACASGSLQLARTTISIGADELCDAERWVLIVATAVASEAGRCRVSGRVCLHLDGAGGRCVDALIEQDCRLPFTPGSLSPRQAGYGGSL